MFSIQHRLLAVPLWIVEQVSKYAIGNQTSKRKGAQRKRWEEKEGLHSFLLQTIQITPFTKSENPLKKDLHILSTKNNTASSCCSAFKHTHESACRIIHILPSGLNVMAFNGSRFFFFFCIVKSKR